MTRKKLNKPFTAVFLSGCLLLQNFPVLAASESVNWLKNSPFTSDQSTEPSSDIPETQGTGVLSSFSEKTEPESETEMENEVAVEAFSPASGFLIAGSIAYSRLYYKQP